MNKLSVVIITFNEEKNIERCLRSVGGIADEIIVVDSFSTDNTEVICARFNVRFSQHGFEGHIEQKNYAMSLATHPFVLSLDADEALSDELAVSIRCALTNWTHDCYTINRLNNFCGQWIRHSGWYPDKKIRLFDKRKARWGGINPHDKIIIEKGATCKELEGNLLHFSFSSISQHIDQINKFSGIKAKGAFAKNKKAGPWHIFILPLVKFFTIYFLKAGFLDGFYGFVIALHSAWSVYLRGVKLRQLYKGLEL